MQQAQVIIHYLVDNFLLGVENFLLNLFEILSQRGLRSSILLRRGLHLARDGLDLSQGVLLAPVGQFEVKKVEGKRIQSDSNLDAVLISLRESPWPLCMSASSVLFSSIGSNNWLKSRCSFSSFTTPDSWKMRGIKLQINVKIRGHSSHDVSSSIAIPWHPVP